VDDPFISRITPSLALVIKLSVMTAVPAKESVETPMPMGLADEVARYAHFAEITSPTDDDVTWRSPDDGYRSRSCRLPRRCRRYARRYPCGRRCCVTARRPPSLTLVTEMPIAALSTMLLAITAPGSRTRRRERPLQASCSNCRSSDRFDPELARIAAQSVMRATEPVDTIAVLAAAAILCGMRSTRLAITMVPSAPISKRQTRMPLSPQSCT
jgi:hypothetical protein